MNSTYWIYFLLTLWRLFRGNSNYKTISASNYITGVPRSNTVLVGHTLSWLRELLKSKMENRLKDPLSRQNWLSQVSKA